MYEDNETLAFEAQNGDMESLYALYANVKKIISIRAHKFYTVYADRCARAGVTQADLEQEGYLAFVQAVNAYEPEAEYKFASYLSFPLHTAFRGACGLRTQKGLHDPLNNADSLNAPIGDEEDGATLADIIPDDAAQSADQATADYDRAVLRCDLEAALSKLDQAAEDTIRRRYFDNLTRADIAKATGKTAAAVLGEEQRGMRKLRTNSQLRRRYEADVISRHAYNGGVGSFNHTWTSSTERAAMKLEEWEARKREHMQISEAIEQINQGKIVVKTLEELEAMETEPETAEPADGYTHNRSLAGHSNDQENAGIL